MPIYKKITTTTKTEETYDSLDVADISSNTHNININSDKMNASVVRTNDDSTISTSDVLGELSLDGNVNLFDGTERKIDTGSSLPSFNDPSTSKNPIIGRTWSDLISEQSNNDRLVFVFWYVIAFIVFIAKTNSLLSLVYPVTVGSFFNFAWFIHPISHIKSWVLRFKK
ncbi:MAG: hypothetical protein Q7V63_01625 [Gammaproteobacteria bacterium]|nr:hypothetical protein [Gammaproteobacteria bacterium]